MILDQLATLAASSADLTVLAAGRVPDVAPNMNALPGGTAVKTLISWIMGIGIAVCVGAFAFGCMRSFAGNRMGNSAFSEDGKKLMIGAPIVAALIVGAPSIIEAATKVGDSI